MPPVRGVSPGRPPRQPRQREHFADGVIASQPFPTAQKKRFPACSTIERLIPACAWQDSTTSPAACVKYLTRSVHCQTLFNNSSPSLLVPVSRSPSLTHSHTRRTHRDVPSFPSHYLERYGEVLEVSRGCGPGCPRQRAAAPPAASSPRTHPRRAASSARLRLRLRLGLGLGFGLTLMLCLLPQLLRRISSARLFLG